MANISQFVEFLADIEPAESTRDEISRAHQKVRKYLREHPTFGVRHRYTFLSGSQARNTAIRPRRRDGVVEKPDADIIVVTNHDFACEPANVIHELRTVLGQEFTIDPKPHSRSVGIIVGGVEIDVVIVIAPPSAWITKDSDSLTLEDLRNQRLFLPDSEEKAWVETNPAKQIWWSTETNRMSEGVFKPLVKMMKWWRRENSDKLQGRHPKGFVLECIVAECISASAVSHEEHIFRLMDNILKRYATDIAMDCVPFIADSGVPTNSVTQRVSFDEFESFYRLVGRQIEFVRKAIAAGDSVEGLRLWRQVFGAAFPPSEAQREISTAATLVAEASRTGITRAVAPSGVVSVGTVNSLTTVVKPHSFYGE